MERALGALFLFLSNVFALVIAGSIVFTLAGYARDPQSSATANRRRAYTVVTVLALITVLPLAANTTISVLLATWSTQIRASAEEWLADEEGARVVDVQWVGHVATITVVDPDGTVPPVETLVGLLDGIPSVVAVAVEVGVGTDIRVR